MKPIIVEVKQPIRIADGEIDTGTTLAITDKDNPAIFDSIVVTESVRVFVRRLKPTVTGQPQTPEDLSQMPKLNISFTDLMDKTNVFQVFATGR